MEPESILVQAARRGLVRLRVSVVARKARVSENTVRAWVRGVPVAEHNRKALARVVCAEPEPAGARAQ